MDHGDGTHSLQRHRRKGHVVASTHFTGKQGSGKRHRKRGLTRKQRRKKRGTHVNKYADAAP